MSNTTWVALGFLFLLVALIGSLFSWLIMTLPMIVLHLLTASFVLGAVCLIVAWWTAPCSPFARRQYNQTY